MTFDMDKSLGFIINRVSLASKNCFNKLIKPYEISAEQWSVLYRVVQKDGIGQKELSDSTYKDQGNLTRMIDILVQKGYLLRDTSNTDRRSIKLFATQKSKNLVEEIIPISNKHNEKLASSLSESEKTQLIELLNKVYNNI